jgi:hypothetical protein
MHTYAGASVRNGDVFKKGSALIRGVVFVKRGLKVCSHFCLLIKFIVFIVLKLLLKFCALMCFFRVCKIFTLNINHCCERHWRI